MHLAQVLKEHRERRRLTLETLAERTGITVSRLAKFESGLRSPYMPDEFFRLARAFRILPSTLARRGMR